MAARPSFFIESLQRLAQTQGTQVPVLSWKQSLREVKNKNRETEVRAASVSSYLGF
jgi:hypothetical protein